MDQHASLKAENNMIVQILRPSNASTSTQQAYSVDSGVQNQHFMATTPSNKRIPLQSGAGSHISGRTLTVTPMQPRFTASSRLGTPQTAAPPFYGLKRPFTHDYGYEFSSARKFPRSTDKSKGLRHFSTKVCEKVKEKGQTNYNEVADELVAEYFDSLTHPPGDSEKQQYDMKNIRRRVYDALNVLMAMNIIEKEKKEIRWVGLPTSSLQECRRLEEERAKRRERIRQKADQLQELIIQLVAYKSLVERNREKERNEGRPAENTILYLPYIVVNTEKRTMIDCAISHDKSEYLFNFDQPFEIHDDIEVLKRLGLAHGLERADVPSEKRNKVKSYLPPALRDYVDQILEGTLCGGTVGPSVKPPVINIAPGLQSDRKPLMTAYGSSPVVRVSSTPGAATSGVGRPYSNAQQGYGTNMRVPQARYAIIPKVVNSSAAASTAKYGPTNAAYRSASGAGRQYVIQQSEAMQQRAYVPHTRQQTVTYTIQAPSQSQMLLQGQRYEEIYEDEDENAQFE